MSEASRSGGDAPGGGDSTRWTREVWWCCAYVATMAGYLCAIAEWGWESPVACSVTVAIVAAVVVAPFKVEQGLGAVPQITRLAIATGLVLPAIAGVVVALGLAGLVLVLALAGTKPGLVPQLRAASRMAGNRAAAKPAEPSPAPTPTSWDEIALEERAPEAPQDLASLDDDALCLAWRRSFILLKAAKSAGERLSIVEKRREYLDELQRRSPQGLATWLASGARASGNPRPYLP